MTLHADLIAALFAALLGRPVEAVRATLKLVAGETLVVGQYSGPRLPEGATTLPEGASVVWWAVTVISAD